MTDWFVITIKMGSEAKAKDLREWLAEDADFGPGELRRTKDVVKVTVETADHVNFIAHHLFMETSVLYRGFSFRVTAHGRSLADV